LHLPACAGIETESKSDTTTSYKEFQRLFSE
jgi:hypothetical protein